MAAATCLTTKPRTSATAVRRQGVVSCGSSVGSAVLVRRALFWRRLRTGCGARGGAARLRATRSASLSRRSSESTDVDGVRRGRPCAVHVLYGTGNGCSASDGDGDGEREADAPQRTTGVVLADEDRIAGGVHGRWGRV